MRRKYNLQFFAEGGEGGNGDPNTGNQNQQQTSQQSTGIDYNKIQNMLDTATAKKENAVLKSYFQQQGLSEEEVNQAIASFKTNKQQNQQQQQVDTTALQNQLTQVQALAEKAEIEKLATIEAVGLGIDAKTLPYVLKMADLSNVEGNDGKVNQEAVKNALNKVLEDVPQLKPAQNTNTGFQIGGAGGNQNNKTDEAALKAAFGL